jgi:hypothetical protein
MVISFFFFAISLRLSQSALALVPGASSLKISSIAVSANCHAVNVGVAVFDYVAFLMISEPDAKNNERGGSRIKPQARPWGSAPNSGMERCSQRPRNIIFRNFRICGAKTPGQKI